MLHHATNAVIVIFSSIMSMGIFCSPEPPPQPPPQDQSEAYRKQFAERYATLAPMVADSFSAAEMEEAHFQDWHGRTDDKARETATYALVIKKHDELAATLEAARTDHDAWTAYFEANKETASTHEEVTKLHTDGAAIMKVTGKIVTDLASLRTKMIQVTP